MRFSDAIREGAKLGPQAFGSGPCALGSAAIAVGLMPAWSPMIPYHTLTGHWPELLERDVPDVKDYSFRGIFRRDAIWHLNDHARWTREQIADWYEATFEQPSNESLILATVEEAKKNALEPEMVGA